MVSSYKPGIFMGTDLNLYLHFSFMTQRFNLFSGKISNTIKIFVYLYSFSGKKNLYFNAKNLLKLAKTISTRILVTCFELESFWLVGWITSNQKQTMNCPSFFYYKVFAVIMSISSNLISYYLHVMPLY